MEEDQLEKFVVAYLKKKGFKQAEHAFQEELQQHQSKNNSSSSISTNSITDPDFAKHLLSFSEYSLSLSINLYICKISRMWKEQVTYFVQKKANEL